MVVYANEIACASADTVLQVQYYVQYSTWVLTWVLRVLVVSDDES